MITTELTNSEVLQKWELPFRDLLDEIWWPGYADELLRDNPDEYAREYWYFIRIYD